MLMSSHAIPPASVDAAIERAAGRLAPLWPLQDFVAVNPFLGYAGESLAQTAEQMARAAGARVLMPLSFYADAIEAGRITMADLARARADAGPLSPLPQAPEALASLAAGATETVLPITPTVTALAADATGNAWEQIAAERLSAWAAGYFDRGQAVWPSPWRHLPPFAAWKAEAAQDRTASIWGLKGFRAIVESLPDSAEAAIHEALHRLAVPEAGLGAYLDRLFASVGGWAAYARQRRWQQELQGGSDESLTALLAARLAWEVALLEKLPEPALPAAWAAACAGLTKPAAGQQTKEALALQALLQAAYEGAWQRELADRFQGSSREAAEEAVRPAVQAVFCIDVRSEVFRRALEAQSPEIETLGFAGFFGFPIAVKAHGADEATAQCPVLLAPQFEVGHDCTGHDHGHAHEPMATPPLQALRRSAVSSFAFVETLGLTYAGKLVADGFAALTGKGKKPEAAPEPPLNISSIPAEKRVDMAEGALKGMSLTENFARLVLLAGHGASTRNNPHARGLDCGACGGHSGAPNARLAAEVLNDPAVREALAARGIVIPADTLFVPALHDTTTDALHLLDTDLLPASHSADLKQLRAWAEAAGRRCRAERAGRLGLPADAAETDPAVLARALDWSQVRPEWGLAGCAGFIAAPRQRTAGLSLEGRCFLHSYDWRQDEGFGVLELIMTAPVIVASWISLQYYGSTVDNRAFGSGNKVLHNVTAGMGVLEGNGGDLRTGLPWQSVHDGENFVHEPMRLSVVVEAPREALSAIIEKHDGLRDLLDHGWISLLTLDDAGCISHRYAPGGAWEPFSAADQQADAAAMPFSRAA